MYRVAGTTASIEAVVVRLDGLDGAWLGSLVGVGDPATGAFRLQGSIRGAGGYDGSVALLDMEATATGSDWAIDGLVVRGDLPPTE